MRVAFVYTAPKRPAPNLSAACRVNKESTATRGRSETINNTYSTKVPRYSIHPLRLPAIILLAIFMAVSAHGQDAPECDSCGDQCPPVAIKTNLLYDAALTPDLGIELSLSRRISVGAEGVCAWWSDNRAHRYWRIRGGWLDASWWFGSAPLRQRMTGHHAGIYASIHDYDFEFGHKGWQSRCPTLGAGLSYGYSFRLNGRLNLDLYVRAGYACGRVTEYVPQCGTYMCLRHFNSHYVGLTGIGVCLVWFPGRGASNSPAR